MKRETFFKTAMCAAFVGLVFCLGASMARAQTTAFTYQGRFTDSSVQQPTSGTYTMTFRLFDAETDGNQIPNNSTSVTSMVSVAGGIFTVKLDFGAAAFATTGARYLEIQVGNQILTPRQEITATPFANRAINAATADSLSSVCVGCVTNAQINSLDGAKITGSVANAGNSDQLGGLTASSFVQTDSNAFVRNQTMPQTADFNINGTGSIGGNVGIGTTATTTEALRVVGGNGTGNTNNVGGAGEGISLQAGNGNNAPGAGGAGASISLQSGSGGTSSGINGGAGAN